MPQPGLSDPPDALPHGLPIRFRSLAVPDPGGRAGADQLVNDLAHSVLDTVTLGGLRQLANQVYRRVAGKAETGGKLLVAGVDGVVNQVSLRFFAHLCRHFYMPSNQSKRPDGLRSLGPDVLTVRTADTLASQLCFRRANSCS